MVWPGACKWTLWFVQQQSKFPYRGNPWILLSFVTMLLTFADNAKKEPHSYSVPILIKCFGSFDSNYQSDWAGVRQCQPSMLYEYLSACVASTSQSALSCKGCHRWTYGQHPVRVQGFNIFTYANTWVCLHKFWNCRYVFLISGITSFTLSQQFYSKSAKALTRQ